MGQVDGTEQAGCVWAARVFYLALRDGKEMGWCSRNNRDEVPCLWQPPPHPGTSPLFWSTGGLWFRVYKQSRPSPAIS